MTLRIDKEPKNGDYNVVVYFENKVLETFRMSWIISKMISEGSDSFPNHIHSILLANKIDNYTLEDVDKILQGK